MGLMQSLWAYLRNGARKAILDGVADALTELDSGDAAPAAELPPAIRERLQLALPAPKNGKAAKQST